LVVNANNNPGRRDSGGEESCGRLLHSVQFGIKDLSSTAKVAASLFHSEELLVPNIEDYPTASGRPSVQL
jgi:hypothetical protein